LKVLSRTDRLLDMAKKSKKLLTFKPSAGRNARMHCGARTLHIISDHEIVREESGTTVRTIPKDIAIYRPSKISNQIELDSIKYTLPNDGIDVDRDAVLVDKQVWEKTGAPDLTLVDTITVSLSEQPKQKGGKSE
jgi:hypothetical protein